MILWSLIPAKGKLLLELYCVIPARGGSKRIPKKNIQLVAGIPLIGHVIRNVVSSKVFKGIFVSTDSEEIAKISIQYGAVVPELRNPNLSDDYTPTRQVIANFISNHKQLQGNHAVIACIYPFAIFSKPAVIQAAADRFSSLENKDKYLVAVQKYSHPAQRALLMADEGLLKPAYEENFELRTQDLSATYHDAGQFYFGKSNTWLSPGSILTNAYGFKVPKHTVVDVDDFEDLEVLRRIFKLEKSAE